MKATRQCAPWLLLCLAAGCASTQGGSTTGQTRWSGSLRAPTMASSAVMVSGPVPGAKASVFGSVTIMPVADQRGRIKYDVSITAPSAAGSQVAWAMYTGSCNTPSPPVIPTNELPVIDVGHSGAGVVRGEVNAELDPRATYHVNVYTTGRASDVSNVMMCAKLTYSGRR